MFLCGLDAPRSLGFEANPDFGTKSGRGIYSMEHVEKLLDLGQSPFLSRNTPEQRREKNIWLLCSMFLSGHSTVGYGSPVGQ